MGSRQGRDALRAADPWTRRLAVAVLAVLSVWPLWVAVAAFLGRLPVGGVDFKAYYLAGLRVRHGLPLYEPALIEAVPPPRAIRYLYPPVVALPFAALTVLPPLPARVAFVGAQFALLWGGVVALLWGYGIELTGRGTLAVGWLVAGVQPVVFASRIGNLTGVLAGLLCLSGALTVAPAGRDRPFVGGALAALAAVPKPYVAPAGAHLRADRRRLLGGGLAVGAVVAGSLLLFGPETVRAYAGVLARGEAWGGARPVSGLSRHYRPFARLPETRTAIQAALLAVAAVTALLARPGDEQLAFGMGCVAVPLVAPSADTLTLLVAGPGLLVVFLVEWRRDGRPAVVLAGALAVQTSVYFVRVLVQYGPEYAPGLPWASARTVVVVQPATVGLLAVFWLCVWRLWTGRLATHSTPFIPAR